MTTTYQVTGLTCAHCVSAVTGELTSLAPVTGVTVNLVPGGRSAVTVTSDVPLAVEDIAGALDEAGDYHLASGDQPSGN
jgi:copper chaperone